MRSFYIHTFGCQMNVHDSQRLCDQLRGLGMREVDTPDRADLLVVNTCSVRDKAEQKLYSQMGKLAAIKKRRRAPPVLAVTGCVAQQKGDALLRRMPFVDIVLGPDNLADLPSLFLAACDRGTDPRDARPVVRTSFDEHTPSFLRAGPSTPGSPSAYVAISKGCDERCSFCIVPHTRGPERDRPVHDILEEITDLVGAGTQEITLLGQTVNGYRDPEGGQGQGDSTGRRVSDFPNLLRAIARSVPALDRLRYMSPHPRFFDSALVEAHRDLDVLCRHVHMPVQSGSDPMLRRMVRRHSRAEFLSSVRALRRACPDLTISTDLIVGFPGESDEDFALTLSLMREVGFVGVFGFKYSPRPATPATRLRDDIPESVKSQRLAQVFALADSLTADHLSTLVGTTQPVLIEGESPRRDGKLTGRTPRNEIVHIPSREGARVGDGIVSVRITRAFRHSLEAELAGPPSDRRMRRRLPVLPNSVS